MVDDLTLTANGRTLVGWEEIAVTLRAESFPNSFEVALSALDPSTGADLAVRPGDACQVALGGDTVITGYVDRVTADGHLLRVIGRGSRRSVRTVCFVLSFCCPVHVDRSRGN